MAPAILPSRAADCSEFRDVGKGMEAPVTLVSRLLTPLIGVIDSLCLLADEIRNDGRVRSVVAGLNDDLTDFGFAVTQVFPLAWDLSALVRRWKDYGLVTTISRRSE
jgi:hypothetical protein